MTIQLRYILLLLIGFLYACGNLDKNKIKSEDKTPWVGKWKMVGFDDVSVADSSTVIFMNLNTDNTIIYLTQTREGETLASDTGEYKINDQRSVLSVYEGPRLVMEYFIRRLDEDSLIFQSDTFSIKWSRIE